MSKYNAIYIATYKNDICEIHKIPVKCMHIYNMYIKYIQDISRLYFNILYLFPCGLYDFRLRLTGDDNFVTSCEYLYPKNIVSILFA